MCFITECTVYIGQRAQSLDTRRVGHVLLVKYNGDSHYTARSLMNRKSFEEIEGVKRKRNENEIRGKFAPFL